jgi:hypothetical protein
MGLRNAYFMKPILIGEKKMQNGKFETQAHLDV